MALISNFPLFLIFFSLLVHQTLAQTCADGQYKDSIGQCKPCDPTCQTCSDGTYKNCTSCFDGIKSLKWIEDGDKDYQICEGTCAPQCKTCEEYSDLCTSCHENAVYDSIKNECITCPSQKYKRDNLCVACDSPCFDCVTSSTNCTSCMTINPLQLMVRDYTGRCCESGQILNSNLNCEYCDPKCNTCSMTSQNCTSCKPTSSLEFMQRDYSGGCCESGQFLNSNLVCENCDSTCNTCSMSPSNCTSCRTTTFLELKHRYNVGKCCESGQFINSQLNCENCDPICQVCSLTSTNCNSCLLNQYVDPDSTDQICLDCHERCKTCNMTAISCTSCKSNMELNSTTQKCACRLDQYLDFTYLAGNWTEPLPDICINCNSNCQTCESSSTFCTSCKPDMQLNQSTHTCTCGPGKYFDTQASKCLNCDSNCLECSDKPNNCTACNLTQIVQNTAGIGKCVCPLNQYLNTSTNLCGVCDTKCSTCDKSSLNCTSCFDVDILSERNKIGRCCLSNEYIDPDYKCDLCDLNCKSCSLKSKNCSSCYGNQMLNITADGTFKCSCLNNQFYNTIGLKCEDCNANCLTCLGAPYNCTSCPNSFTLQNGYCGCNSNQFLDSLLNSCIDCDKSCNRCLGSSFSECIECADGYSFENGNCISLCTTSQYFDKTTFKCYPCNSDCETCYGPSSNECLTCRSNNFFKENMCLTHCPSSDFEDKKNKICVPCDNSCLTCSGITRDRCSSCRNNTFLFNSMCVDFCPSGYFTNNTNNSCDFIEISNISAQVTAINNPYKFLLVFYPPPKFNISFNKYVRQELVLNTSLKIADNRPFTYSILPSEINSSSYILTIDYANNDSLDNTSSMSLSFNNDDNPYIEIVNDNFTVSLVEGHECDATLEYYDEKTKTCAKRYKNDFFLSYGDQANVILVKFNDLNEQIKSELNNKLLVIKIDGFVYEKDYTYNFTNNSNTISVIFTYERAVVGGILLSLSLNSSIFQSLNYQNQTAYLVNHDYSLKLQDYYFLSESEQKTINGTAQVTSSGSTGSTSAVYASMFLSPGSTFAIRGMLLMNIIQLLRYIDISYPPNVVALFKNDNSRMIFKENMVDDTNEKIPTNFSIYGIYCSLLNNSFDEFFQLCMIFILCYLVYLLLTRPKFWKKNETLISIEETLKSTFVWNLIVMSLMSKYLKAATFVFLFLRYKGDVFGFIPEFFFALIYIIYIVYLPIHLMIIIRNIKKFEFEEATNKVTPITNNNASGSSNDTLSPNIQKSQSADPFNQFNMLKASSIYSPNPDTFYDIQKPKKSSDAPITSPNLKQNIVKISPQEWKPIPKSSAESPLKTKKCLNINVKEIDNDDSVKNRLKESNLELMTALPPNIKKDSNNTSHDKNDDTNAKFPNDPITPFDVKILNSEKKTFWHKFCISLINTIKYPFILTAKNAYRLYNPKDNDEFSFRYRVLLKGFNRNRRINKYYFVMDLLRFFLLALIITLFFNSPIVQIFLIESICFMFYAYLIVFRPFLSKIEMILCFINEGLVNTAFLSAAIIALMDSKGMVDSEIRMKLGWSIAFSYLILMYGLMANALYKILLLIYLALKSALEKAKEKKDGGKQIKG